MNHRVLCWCVAVCVMWSLAVQAQETSMPRIITGSNVRVRQEPNTSAPEVARLSLGTIVWEFEKTDLPQAIGQMEDHWYHVTLPDGQTGWVFGSLTLPFDEERKAEIYQKISRARLAREKLSFSDQVDFFHFLTKAIEQVTEPEIAAELKLARLMSLQRSLQEQHTNPPDFEGWIKEQQTSVYYNEVGGEWLVSPALFWQLQEDNRVLLIADDIAWEAANNQLGGECEGYLPCHLSRENQTMGKYVGLYPQGKHISQALDHIANNLAPFTTQKFYDYDRSDYMMIQHEVDQLRGVVEKTSAADRENVLQQLRQIERLHLQQQ